MPMSANAGAVRGFVKASARGARAISMVPSFNASLQRGLPGSSGVLRGWDESPSAALLQGQGGRRAICLPSSNVVPRSAPPLVAVQEPAGEPYPAASMAKLSSMSRELSRLEGDKRTSDAAAKGEVGAGFDSAMKFGDSSQEGVNSLENFLDSLGKPGEIVTLKMLESAAKKLNLDLNSTTRGLMVQGRVGRLSETEFILVRFGEHARSYFAAFYRVRGPEAGLQALMRDFNEDVREHNVAKHYRAYAALQSFLGHIDVMIHATEEDEMVANALKWNALNRVLHDNLMRWNRGLDRGFSDDLFSWVRRIHHSRGATYHMPGPVADKFSSLIGKDPKKDGYQEVAWAVEVERQRWRDPPESRGEGEDSQSSLDWE